MLDTRVSDGDEFWRVEAENFYWDIDTEEEVSAGGNSTGYVLYEEAFLNAVEALETGMRVQIIHYEARGDN